MKKHSADFMIDGVNELLTQIGINIRTARMRRSMTIKELANRVHVDERTISRMESGDPSINFKNLLTVLIVFGLQESALSIANPNEDEVGKAIELQNAPKRIRSSKITLDDDF